MDQNPSSLINPGSMKNETHATGWLLNKAIDFKNIENCVLKWKSLRIIAGNGAPHLWNGHSN